MNKFIKKHYILIDSVILVLIVLCLFIMYNVIFRVKNNTVLTNIDNISYGHVSLKNNNLTKEKEIKTFLDSYDKLDFILSTFQMDKDTFVELVYKENETNDKFNYLDIFNTNVNYSSSDKSIIYYLSQLEVQNPELFNNNYSNEIYSEEYIISLIDYFTDIFDNVDPVIAKSIGLIESGYSSVNMLSKNNIYGGMSGGVLISYKSIEYGVMKYIKLLSDNYFGQGLVTVEDICYKYNPIIINGVKSINYTWVNNVKLAMEKYN